MLPRLSVLMRELMVRQRYSDTTIKAYIGWGRRFQRHFDPTLFTDSGGRREEKGASRRLCKDLSKDSCTRRKAPYG